MRRRNFIAAGTACVGTLMLGRGLAQQQGPRGAVVIGVDKCGNLPVLSAAGAGAEAMGTWLGLQGYEVKLITDKKGTKEVRLAEVFDAIEEFVNRGTLEQLVVYFSGHGFLKETAEHWMLSRAPVNPNEAASLTESVDFAKDSGIPNVTFISDACRSTPTSLEAERVHPGVMFPNIPVGQSRGKVDTFLATLPGRPALELPVSASSAIYQGIFTAAFLQAFQAPDESMVVPLADGRRVVPNRRLEDYLKREVKRLAHANADAPDQVPECNVVSSDDVFIGQVSAGTTVSPTPSPPTEATIVDVARFELVRSGLTASIMQINLPDAEIARVVNTTGFGTARSAILESFDTDVPEVQSILEKTGFAVSGVEVTEVATHPEYGSNITRRGGWTAIEVDTGGRPACSVAIRFADGTGTVVAALKDFVGSITASAIGVSNVAYDPARSNWRFGDFASERERLSQLRANVATAAKFGVFRFNGTQEDREKQAASLANQVRVGKGFDPTLGLYAAYAYFEADLLESIRSVHSYMRGDLETALFDVAMLAEFLSGPESDQSIAPFCPMLTQGWSLLRVKRVDLPEIVTTARDHLLPALWTTFDQAGMDILTGALRSGQLR